MMSRLRATHLILSRRWDNDGGTLDKKQPIFQGRPFRRSHREMLTATRRIRGKLALFIDRNATLKNQAPYRKTRCMWPCAEVQRTCSASFWLARNKEKAAEIPADLMTTFYHVEVDAQETQEFRTTPVPFWHDAFSPRVKGQPLRQMCNH
jgi:hypothetical protein